MRGYVDAAEDTGRSHQGGRWSLQSTLGVLQSNGQVPDPASLLQIAVESKKEQTGVRSGDQK